MSDEIDKMIGRLSPAQKRCILSASFNGEWATVLSLVRRGILLRRVCHPDGNGISLTLMGQTMRDRLREKA